ncbi:MYCBP-associated protein-like isoform X3 [Clavelina lepadiformis]|uniref:MYCBP-associated protein-like isoform X3 n=1 Tax=Clavelina lepadiformis TaxID=159417 RepID=UPI0040416B47
MWNVAKAAGAFKGLEKKHHGGASEARTPGSVAGGDGEQDDDKARKKTLPCSPDKLTSPGVTPEEQKNDVINNTEIQRLAIKDENLAKLRQTQKHANNENRDDEKMTSYAVRKAKPQCPSKLKPSKKIVVARAAPPNAEPKQTDHSVPSGPRYAKDGRIIPHSVLGSVQNFVEEAIRRNDLRPDSPAVTDVVKGEQRLDATKYLRPKSPQNELIPTALDQEKALLNWRKRMADRKRQQGYISSLLQKPQDRLVMNQDDEYRSIQEKRKLLDRAIPAVDYGKGYRVGSEFWGQRESFGDDLKGIKMTLTKTEKGSPVEFEHIGKPTSVKHEIGATWAGERPTADPRRNWYSSRYLKRRTRELEAIMTELDPYRPAIADLEVIGNLDQSDPAVRRNYDEAHSLYDATGVLWDQKLTDGDPLSKYPDVISKPVIGPSIVFNGTRASWNGSSTEHKDKVGVVARVTFETKATERTSSDLVVENDGTTAIYFEWRKIPRPPAFESLKPDTLQRFYFNTGQGVILPGDTKKFPFVFKSPNAGIFTETWELLTRPTVMGGAALQVVLKGIALQDDSSTEERMRIEKELEAREAKVVVKRIIEDIVRGIQSPERSPSPIDAYITEEEVFSRKNPGCFYDHETILELKNIYLQLFAEDEGEGREWDLSLDELQSCVTAVPDEEAREELLTGLNKIIGRLSFPPLTPSQRLMYNAGYRMWQDTVDRLVSCSMMVRNIMGLPEVIMTEAIPEPEPDCSVKSFLSPSPAKVVVQEEKKAKGKKSTSKDAKDDKGKKGGKKDRPKSKDLKGKAGKVTSQSPNKELQLVERDIGSKTPSSVRTVPTDNLDPATRKKYTEKMYGQVYELLAEMIDNMALAFEETKLSCI